MEKIQKFFAKEEKIKDDYEYIFDIPEDGLYLIEIIASAKSWWQNLLKIKFGDDDLTVKIDNLKFSKLNKKKGLFDGEVAWNGNNLKGLSKTNIFVVNLSQGTHTLTFLVDKNPTLKSIKIDKVGNEINYIPEDNNPAEDGDRRQWMTIAFAGLSLENLIIRAFAKNYSDQNDDDDIKLIVDGNIKENTESKAHKNWYWCGKTLNGLEKEFNEDLNKTRGLHYIELWADRIPKIKSIVVSIEKNNFEDKKTPEYIIKKIQGLYREIGQEIEFDKIPIPAEMFNEYDKEIELASAEFDVEPSILKATIAQESSFGNNIEHDWRYVGESGLVGMEKDNSIAQLEKLGYAFNHSDIPDVIRASSAYYKWLASIKSEMFKDNRNPLKLYTQYRKDLEARNTKAPGIKEFLYYYFYYKQ